MKSLAKGLSSILDRSRIKTEIEDRLAYNSDATHYFATGTPDAVVLPRTAAEVSGIIKYAAANQIPVTPRGAGSGLSGGCTPIKGGIVLDMKQMNRIVEMNTGNMTATVEAGMVLSHFHRMVEKQNLFYPPDPQSMSVCTLGGNVATRAGGPRGVKYGTTGNYVIGLEVVLPDGEIIKTGSTCVKHAVGYDITHLMTGSEGTLGVITNVTARLIPLPPYHRTIVIACRTAQTAAELVSAVTAAGAIPAMLEYVSQTAASMMNRYLEHPMPPENEAYLLLDLDGSQVQIEADSLTISSICRDMDDITVRVIENPVEAAAYWNARANLHPLVVAAVRRLITEDVTVPRDRFPEFFHSLSEVAAATGMVIAGAGHAGDGNIHPSVLMMEINETTLRKAQDAIALIIKKALSLGGSISGEHGIGLHKSEFIEQDLGKRQVQLLRQIKGAVDPVGIMNPGKIWMAEAS